MRCLALICTAATPLNERTSKGNGMAEKETSLTSPPAQDTAAHVRDYSRFTKLLKWTAIVCFIIAMLVILLIT